MSNQDCWPIPPPLQKLLQGRRGLPSGYQGVVCQHLQNAFLNVLYQINLFWG